MGLSELLKSFIIYDANRYSLISKAELKHILESAGENLPDTEVTAMMAAADTDDDGLISFKEYVTLVTR